MVSIYKKTRPDRLLVDNGLAPTRARAADLIRRGCVSVGGKPQSKLGALVLPDAELAVSPEACAYVSRGALKLEAWLDAFGFDPKGRVAIDVGASTGGFTEVLIARDAASVYAVDVGRGQLHAKLSVNPKVVALDGTDARALDRSVIREAVTAIVADVSFIGLALALPVVLPRRGRGSWPWSSRNAKPGATRSAKAASSGTRPRGDRPSPRCDILSRRRVGPLSARPPRQFLGAAVTRNS